MDVVVIPTHERPELLWLCLEKIAACSDIPEQIWISEDFHIDNPKPPMVAYEVEQTVEYAKRILPGVRHIRREHSNHGSSFNVLESFREACQTDARYVFFIEDDTMVTQDFFRWSRAAQEKFHPFATCSNYLPRERSQHPEDCAISDTWLQTFGMSFEREKLSHTMLPDYADYGLQPQFEWDAWMMKYIRLNGLYSVSACLRRGYHFGFYSYHAGGDGLRGDLASRVQQVRAGLSNPSLLRTGGSQNQIFPYPEGNTNYQWTELRKRTSSVRRLA